MTGPLNVQQMRQLVAPLNPARIATRKQGGTTLSYLEAWDVRRSLIRIFGFGGWSAELIDSEILYMQQSAPAFEYNQNKNAPKVQRKDHNGEPVFNWVVAAKATVRLSIPQLGCVYTEAAVASQTGPDVGEVGDFAVKTAESDAFKRCAMNLGTQMGLSLYDDGNTSDVVQMVLEEGQRALLAEVRKPKDDQPAKSADATVAVSGGYTDQEGDWHDSEQSPFDMPDEPDPQAMAEARGSVQSAFGG